MNTKVVLSQAEQLHANAKNGTVTIDGVKYLLTFDGRNYVVSRADGVEMSYPLNFNTRKVTQARQWLREWLAS